MHFQTKPTRVQRSRHDEQPSPYAGLSKIKIICEQNLAGIEDIQQLDVTSMELCSSVNRLCVKFGNLLRFLYIFVTTNQTYCETSLMVRLPPIASLQRFFGASTLLLQTSGLFQYVNVHCAL